MTTQTTDVPLSTRASRRAGQGSAPTAERLPVPLRRRRPMLALLALVLILGGAALAATLVLASGKKQQYLLVTNDIAVGQTLAREDFRQQPLAAASSSVFAPVPVADFYSRVQGKKALIPLKRGSLLSEGTFGDAVTPAANLGQMSLNLPEGRYPPGLAAGDLVKVLYTPGSSAGAGGGAPATGGDGPRRGATLVPAAYVSSVEPSSSGQNGLIVGIDIRNVELAMSPRAGLPAVAVANAANAITLVRLDPRTEYDRGDG